MRAAAEKCGESAGLKLRPKRWHRVCSAQSKVEMNPVTEENQEDLGRDGPEEKKIGRIFKPAILPHYQNAAGTMRLSGHRSGEQVFEAQFRGPVANHQ